MSSKALSKMIRAADIAIALCGLVVCIYILPIIGADVVKEYPEFSHWYLPWFTFLMLTAAPCFAVLVVVWKLAAAIRQERVFTIQTAHLVKYGSLIILCDVGFFFIGNIVFLLLNMNHPGVILLSLFVDIFGITLAVSAATLSRYITRASALQEEVDGTI